MEFTLCDAMFAILRHRQVDPRNPYSDWHSDSVAMRWWMRVERRWRELGGDRLHDESPATPSLTKSYTSYK